jgi:hypothetical protein
MSLTKLKYPALRLCDDLRRTVANNLDRYLNGDFMDLADSDDWSIPLSIDVDLEPLKELTSNADDEVKNSMLVWNTLSHLDPSLASEGRVWTRLAHIECLEYGRKRWVKTTTGEDAVKKIEDHFFASTRTQCRDDNTIGRLWWTAYVAKRAMPDAHEDAVRAIWGSQDIRSNVIERPWISIRPKLAASVVRAILNIPSVTASETAFREFMKTVNRLGGGVIFEAMTDEDIDSFVASCAAASVRDGERTSPAGSMSV